MTGEVRLRLEAGRCDAGRAGARRRGLYDHDLATYGDGDTFRHDDSAGFVRLWGLVGRDLVAPSRAGCAVTDDGTDESSATRAQASAADRLCGTAASAKGRPTSCSRSRSACRSTGGSPTVDIVGSRAHVTMLARQGLLDDDERAVIVAALDRVRDRARTTARSRSCRPTKTSTPRSSDASPRSPATPAPSCTPVAAATTRSPPISASGCGTPGATRSSASSRCRTVLLRRADEAGDTYLPGYTHLQRAQPVLLAHHLLAHFWALAAMSTVGSTVSTAPTCRRSVRVRSRVRACRSTPP